MHIAAVITLTVFILSWLGAATAWTVAAHSTVRLWSGGRLAPIERYRARALKAGMVSVTFLATGFLAAMASGLFTQVHI